MRNILITTIFLGASLSLVGQEQSPFLEKYRTMALEYNHDLKAAEKNISASIDLEKMAKADMKPKLGGGANLKYTGNPTELNLNLPGLANPISVQGDHMQYGTSVSLQQPIYTGGRVLESIRIAQHQGSLSIHEAEVVYSAVCYQTDIQYWNSVARGEMVHIAADFHQSISSLVETVKERVEVGLVDVQDLLMVEVKQNEAEYQLLQAKNNFIKGRMALNSIIGVDLQNQTELDEKIPAVLFEESLLAEDKNDRPEINQAQDRIEIAKSSLKLNDSKYKPQIYAGLDGSYSSPGYNFDPDLNLNYGAYLKLSIPIFEWGKRRSEKRMSSQKIGIATDYLNKTVDGVNLEVETAKVALMQGVESVRLSENSLEKASDNEEKANERYTEGKISILEVIDAQIYRQTSQINYVQAKVTAQTYYSELLRVLNAYNSK